MIPFKGKVKLELMDSKKNIVQKIEGHNMPTKALEYFYKQGGITNPSAFNASAIRDNPLLYLLGGVMCLDTALSEDDTIVRVPAGVGMTANGGRGQLNSGDPIELGSWNETESGWAQDGSFRMVWDWTTSQGNGNIACVCLSSLYGGFKGIGNKSLTNKNFDVGMNNYNSASSYSSELPNNKQGIFLGRVGNVGTFLVRTEGTAYGYDTAADWTIYKVSMPTTAIDVRDSLTRRLIKSKNVANPRDLHEYGNGTFRCIQVGNYAYLMCAYAHTSGSYYTRYYHFDDSYPVIVFKYDLVSDSVAQIFTLSPTTTGATSFELDGGVVPTMFCNGKWAVYHNLLIDMSNLVNVREITNFSENSSLVPISDDIAESAGQRLDLTTGVALPTNYNATNYTQVYMDKLLGDTGSSIWRDPRYIATIFNLSSPVTKTADKTMKVTYVLRFPN